MHSRTYLAAGLLIAYSTFAAASTAIGTASARGNIRVDGYAISGNATLFDGTAVQTNQASATLRLEKGTEIKLATQSMGTLYRDHMVLQQGATEVSTSNSFSLSASGFHVVPASGSAHGVVEISGLGTIQVAAMAGDFQVTNARGLVLAKVHPGKAMSFALQAGGAVTVSGVLSKANGHYYVTDATGIHEIVGHDVDKEVSNKGLDKYVGKQVTISGTLDTAVQPTGGAMNVIDVASIDKAAGGAQMGGGTSFAPAIIEGGAAAAFLAAGIYEASTTPTSASR